MPPLDQVLSVSGTAEAKAAIADLSQSGSASFKSLEGAAKSVGDNGVGATGASVNQLVGILTGLHGNVSEISGAFGTFTGILSGLAPAFGALGGAISAAGIVKLASDASEAARNIQNMAAATGSSVGEIEGFQYALASVGTGTEAANTALTHMLAYLGQTDDALKKVADSSQAMSEAAQASTDAANLSAETARNAVSNAATAYQTAVDGIGKAQVAADTAQRAFKTLSDQIKASNATGEQAATNAQRLRDAQINLQNAVDNVALAQQRANQAATNQVEAAKRADIADEQRRATIDKLAEAQDKGVTATQAWLQQIGVTSADLTEAQTNGTEAFYKIIQGLHDTADAAELADRARTIFGRGWITLIPAIAAGGNALKAFSDQFEQTGLGLDKNAYAAASAFQKASGQLAFFVDTIKNYLGTRIANVLAPLVQAIDDFITKNAAGIKAWADGFANALGIVIDGIRLFVPLLAPLGATLQLINAGLDGIAATINAVFGTQLTGPTLAFLALFGLFVPRFLSIGSAAIRLGTYLLGLRPILQAVALALGSFGPAGVAAAEGLAKFATAGGAIGGILAAIVALIVYNIQNWDSQVKGWSDAIGGFWQLLQALYNYIVNTVVQGFQLWVGDVQNGLVAMGGYLQTWIDAFNNGVQSVFDFFKNGWNAAVAFVENLWNGLVDWATGVADKIKAIFEPVVSFLQNVISLISGASNASASVGASGFWRGGPVRAAGGGHIVGPGTGKSDSIPALVSTGEYVLNSDAVSRVGVGFLNALNSGAVAMRSMGGAIRMALGGPIGPQRFSGGGYVAAATTGNPGGLAGVHLHIGSDTFSLMGPKGIVSALTSAARKAAIKSAGRKPSWAR